MKKFDVKSAVAGFLAGVLLISSTFAVGSGIRFAEFNTTKVTLDGVDMPLKNALLSVGKDGERDTSNYMPLRELLEKLGYKVDWDGENNTVKLTSPGEVQTAGRGDVIIDVNTSKGSHNIAKSGSFQAKDGQSLKLKISSQIGDGSVDLFLFSPSGEETRITLTPSDKMENILKEIPLSNGVWAYNCTGFFESGSVYINGTIME